MCLRQIQLPDIVDLRADDIRIRRIAVAIVREYSPGDHVHRLQEIVPVGLMIANRLYLARPGARFTRGPAQVGRHGLLVVFVSRALIDDQRRICQAKTVIGQDPSEKMLVERFRLVRI